MLPITPLDPLMFPIIGQLFSFSFYETGNTAAPHLLSWGHSLLHIVLLSCLIGILQWKSLVSSICPCSIFFQAPSHSHLCSLLSGSVVSFLGGGNNHSAEYIGLGWITGLCDCRLCYLVYSSTQSAGILTALAVAAHRTTGSRAVRKDFQALLQGQPLFCSLLFPQLIQL